MTKRLLWAAALAAIAGCGKGGSAPLPPVPAGPTGPSADEKTLEVRLSRPKRETVCVGELKARRTTRLGAQVSGRVAEVLVEEGAIVKAKQELVKLDTATFELEIAVKEARTEASAVALADAEMQFARAKALWEKPAGQEPSIPRKQYDDAKTRLDAANVQVKLDEAELKLARQKLKDAVVVAPYDGVVTQRFVDPGQPVTSPPVTELLEIREVAMLDLEFRMPQQMLSRIGAKTPIAWEIDGVAEAGGAGTVSLILPEVDEATRTFRCRTAVDNADGRFRPGLLARVRVIEESPREALFVPSVAVAPSASGPTARVLESGKPAARPVRTGESYGDFTEILEGLSSGDQILVPNSR